MLSSVALTVAVAATGGPALAGKVAGRASGNADRVDGFHAVGAKASLSERAGKLVATDKSGRLPDDVMRPRTAFPDQVPYEHTVRGYWSIDSQDDSAAAAGDWGTFVSYPARMPGLVVRFVTGAPTAECPGSVAAPEATPGSTCVYVNLPGAAGVLAGQPIATAASNEYGAGWYFSDDGGAGDVYVTGTWAANVAPPAGRPSPRPVPAGK